MLLVVVTDAATRAPIEQVVVEVSGARGRTGADGSVRLSGELAGSRTLTATHLGYVPASVRVEVAAEGVTTLRVALSAAPVAVAGVEVRTRAEPRSRVLRDFYRRAQTGQGRYFTRAQIEQHRPRQLTDLFRLVPGMVVSPGRMGESAAMGQNINLNVTTTRMRPDADPCPIRYFVDGTPYEPLHSGAIGADLRPEDVEGIEIYRHPSAAPARFRGSGTVCGIVLIWLREKI